MTLPSSSPVSFVPPSGTFTVESITDLSNNVLGNAVDLDEGFKINGNLQLPNWLNGSGQVCVYADELGGPVNQRLGNCVPITIDPTPTDPSGLTTYTWTITYPGTPLALPDPQPGDSQFYRLAAVFTYESQLTDIQAAVDMGMWLMD
jgi:hypothetical protein